MEKCLNNEIVIVGDLILTEILQGITNENDATLVLKELSVRKTIDILIGTLLLLSPKRAIFFNTETTENNELHRV